MSNVYFSLNKLKEESVRYLEEYLEKHNKKLSVKQKKIVNNLIKIKKENIRKFADEILKSPLFYLASVKILQKTGIEIHETHPAKILLTMFDIVSSAHQKQSTLEALNRYYKESDVRYFEKERK